MDPLTYNTTISTVYPTLESKPGERQNEHNLRFQLAKLDNTINEGPYMETFSKVYSVYGTVLNLLESSHLMVRTNPSLQPIFIEFLQNNRSNKIIDVLLTNSFLIPLKQRFKLEDPPKLPSYKIIERVKFIIEFIYDRRSPLPTYTSISFATTINLLRKLQAIFESLQFEREIGPLRPKDSIKVLKARRLRKEIPDDFSTKPRKANIEVLQAQNRAWKAMQINFHYQMVEESIFHVLTNCKPDLGIFGYLREEYIKHKRRLKSANSELKLMMDNLLNSCNNNEIPEEQMGQFKLVIIEILNFLQQSSNKSTVVELEDLVSVYGELFGDDKAVNNSSTGITVIKNSELHRNDFSESDYRYQLDQENKRPSWVDNFKTLAEEPVATNNVTTETVKELSLSKVANSEEDGTKVKKRTFLFRFGRSEDKKKSRWKFFHRNNRDH
ncbi:uncharacterized protein RJT20DRAFT_31817 [Scheffersomyces xylosifermentans]|uniref:uncharacterized protein n=1 Tax=Scheffersomyces xylosifermentans TaxID=1304137 RepID=UPI00315C5777